MGLSGGPHGSMVLTVPALDLSCGRSSLVYMVFVILVGVWVGTLMLLYSSEMFNGSRVI